MIFLRFLECHVNVAKLGVLLYASQYLFGFRGGPERPAEAKLALSLLQGVGALRRSPVAHMSIERQQPSIRSVALNQKYE